MEGKTLQAAASSAAMSERSARERQWGSFPLARRKAGMQPEGQAGPFSAYVREWLRASAMAGSRGVS